MQYSAALRDSQAILWQLCLGWALSTFLVLVLVAIVLDIFRLRTLEPTFRPWIYGVFLVGLLGGASAWYTKQLKLSPDEVAHNVTSNAFDSAVDEVYTPPPPAPPVTEASSPNVKAGSYKVFIQFAGILRREDVIKLAASLQKAEWNVQDASRGGQRTGAAAGVNEVRYSDSADKAAAEELARQVQNLNLTGSSIAARKTSGIDRGSLEVWLSR